MARVVPLRVEVMVRLSTAAARCRGDGHLRCDPARELATCNAAEPVIEFDI
jgi:hypothetical protein